jgi:hypothetical protein
MHDLPTRAALEKILIKICKSIAKIFFITRFAKVRINTRTGVVVFNCRQVSVKNLENQISQKFSRWQSTINTDGQTEMPMLEVVFRNFFLPTCLDIYI